MTAPHDPVSYLIDPHPVRPGTSAALTARTIDATQRPPLVQAQETVAALIPRLAVPLSSPLLPVMLAGTLVLVWLAMRARSRLVPVLLSAMLMMTLTSFRPVQIADEEGSPDEVQVVDEEVDEDDERTERFERREVAPPVPEPPEFDLQIPTPPEVPTPDVGRIMQEEELREAIEELRLRIEEELRRRGEQPHYQTRSARWIRGRAPSVQEWVVVRQRP